jgi:hypothetical protein
LTGAACSSQPPAAQEIVPIGSARQRLGSQGRACNEQHEESSNGNITESQTLRQVRQACGTQSARKKIKGGGQQDIEARQSCEETCEQACKEAGDETDEGREGRAGSKQARCQATPRCEQSGRTRETRVPAGFGQNRRPCRGGCARERRQAPSAVLHSALALQ